MNYYEHHIGDYARDTTTLSVLEHGVYRLLLDFYYTKEHALPAAIDKVYKAAKATNKAERAAVDSVLADYFTATPEGFSHKTCDEVIAKFHAAQAESAQKDEEKRANDKERQARARERRKHLFSELRKHGIVPPYDTKNPELEAMLSRVTPPEASEVVTPPVTRDNTATQKPVPSNQSPGLIHEEPDGSLPPSGQSPKVAKLQKLIDDIEGKGGAYKPPPCPHEKVLELWKALLPALPQHTVWTAKRNKHLQTRWRETAVAEQWTSVEDGLHYFAKLFRWVGTSKFLTGKSNPAPGRTTFVIELEWLINPSNWAKVIEGKYHTEG